MGEAWKVEEPKELAGRTFQFAQAVRRFVDRLPRTIAIVEDAKQLVRSSGSVAANYEEAQEAVSRKDFFYRIKICRKEAKESWLWLRLIEIEAPASVVGERDRLIIEADELKRIFASIAKKDDTA
jgi:four helix bundle protein